MNEMNGINEMNGNNEMNEMKWNEMKSTLPRKRQ